MLSALLVFAGWIFSLCLHEFGHAFVAYLGGDKSVKDKGYLTFNPLRYTDPELSLALPIIFLLLGGIALPGGAVYIDNRLLRNKFWQSAVSLAGPMMTLIAAELFSLPRFFVFESSLSTVIISSCMTLTLLNLMAFMLNTLPIPGLDGFGVIEPWLPNFIRLSLRQYARAGIFLLFAALWFIRPLNTAFWETGLAWAGGIWQMTPDTVYLSFQAFLSQKYLLAATAVAGLLAMHLLKSLRQKR